MRLKPITILISALLLMSIEIIESKQFCEEFGRNQFKISYPFRTSVLTQDPNNYLIIGQSYWRLNFTDNEDDKKKIVSLASEKSEESDWFGSQYSMGFCVRKDDKRCKSGLLNFDYNLIDWNYLYKNLTIIKFVDESSTISFKFTPFAAFVPNWSQDNKRLVVFLYRTPTLKYEVFYFDNFFNPKGGEEWEKHVKRAEQWLVTPKSLLELSPQINIIGVIAQYSPLNIISKNSVTGNGMIILFDSIKSISYCYSRPDVLSYSCKEDLKILINCSHIVIPGPEQPFLTNTVLIVLIIVSVIAIIVLVPGIIYFHYYYIYSGSESTKTASYIPPSDNTETPS